MGGSGGLSRQSAPDAATAQFREAGFPALPLSPEHGSKPSPDPLVEAAQRRRGFAEAEVAAPSDQVARQLLGRLREARASRPPRQRPHAFLETDHSLRRDPALWRRPAREAEAEELAPVCRGQRPQGAGRSPGLLPPALAPGVDRSDGSVSSVGGERSRTPISPRPACRCAPGCRGRSHPCCACGCSLRTRAGRSAQARWFRECE